MLYWPYYLQDLGYLNPLLKTRSIILHPFILFKLHCYFGYRYYVVKIAYTHVIYIYFSEYELNLDNYSH